MSSILTNMSAMSAVANLAATQKSLSMTQNEISTGLKVGSASDNAAYWSISTAMKTQTGELDAVTSSLNLGSSVVGTATAALNTTISIMQKMQDDLVSAQQAGVDESKVQTDIAALQNQLKLTVNSASFNGVNLLDQASTAVTKQSIVASVTGSGSNFAVGTIDINYSDTALTSSSMTSGQTGILDKAGSNYTGGSILSFSIFSSTTNSSGTTTTTASSTDLSNLSKDVDLALASITTAAAKLGSTQTNINLQSTFVSSLSDAITAGVGSLVDADMNAASTRLNALQTQQQLGIQALSIANQNSQIILKLFGG